MEKVRGSTWARVAGTPIQQLQQPQQQQQEKGKRELRWLFQQRVHLLLQMKMVAKRKEWHFRRVAPLRILP